MFGEIEGGGLQRAKPGENSEVLGAADPPMVCHEQLKRLKTRMGSPERILINRVKQMSYEQTDVLHNFLHPKLIINKPTDYVLRCFLYQCESNKT